MLKRNLKFEIFCKFLANFFQVVVKWGFGRVEILHFCKNLRNLNEFSPDDE